VAIIIESFCEFPLDLIKIVQSFESNLDFHVGLDWSGQEVETTGSLKSIVGCFERGL
jgi:hypothetical protein